MRQRFMIINDLYIQSVKCKKAKKKKRNRQGYVEKKHVGLSCIKKKVSIKNKKTAIKINRRGKTKG